MSYCVQISPEWVQAIGVVIASIGLVITLILQRKTLKEQQKITILEQIKFVNSYQPILELGNINYVKDAQNRIISFKVTIRENYFQMFTVSHNFPDDYEISLPYVIEGIILPIGSELKFKISFALAPVFAEVEEYSGNTFILEYDDAFGNHYKQPLIYKGGDSVFLHPAVRVENESNSHKKKVRY